MKWAFSVQQKLKIAGLLAFLLVLVIVTNLLGNKNIGNLDRSFASIYNDRLIPATEIIYLTEHMYRKHLLLQHYLLAGEAEAQPVRAHLHRHNQQIDSLITEFGKTYLLDRESQVLAAYKQKVAAYAQVEEEILALGGPEATSAGTVLFETKGRQVFQGTMDHLHELTQIQSDVGGELIKGSRVIVASTHIISSLQIGVAVLIGIIVQILLLTSRIIKFNPKNFNWN